MTALALLVSAVLDQRDDPGAAVELAGGEVIELDSRCLPRRSQEGDSLRAVRSTRSCPHRFRAKARFNRSGGTPAQQGEQDDKH